MYILLYLFWIILNGRVTAEILLIGLVLTAGIGLLVKVLFGYDIKKDLRFLKKAPLFAAYVFVLILEILKASLSTMKTIFGARKNIHPVLVTFRSGLKTDFGRFVLANSITLTPGTITIDIRDDVFTVHCLTPEALDVSENSVFLKWIRRLEA